MIFAAATSAVVAADVDLVQLEQEDAQEFLQFLVDAAHEELIKLRSELPAAEESAAAAAAAPATGPPDATSSSQAATDDSQQQQGDAAADDDEEWATVGRGKKNKAAVTRGREDLGGTSLLSAIFRGSIKSCVKAKGVPSARASITVQPFSMLHLDIQADNVRSIEDALDKMCHTEIIHGKRSVGGWYQPQLFTAGCSSEEPIGPAKLAATICLEDMLGCSAFTSLKIGRLLARCFLQVRQRCLCSCLLSV